MKYNITKITKRTIALFIVTASCFIQFWCWRREYCGNSLARAWSRRCPSSSSGTSALMSIILLILLFLAAWASPLIKVAYTNT